MNSSPPPPPPLPDGDYGPPEGALTCADISKAICPLIASLFPDEMGVRVIAEPCRFFVEQGFAAVFQFLRSILLEPRNVVYQVLVERM